MKIMIDLNVVLDVVQKRMPYYDHSAAVISKVLDRDMTGVLPGHAITTIYYLVDKHISRQKADAVIDWLLQNFEVVPLHKTHFLRARDLAMSDFEDAVVASLAEAAGCDWIVTRNISDFQKSPIAAITPTELLVRVHQALPDEPPDSSGEPTD